MTFKWQSYFIVVYIVEVPLFIATLVCRLKKAQKHTSRAVARIMSVCMGVCDYVRLSI